MTSVLSRCRFQSPIFDWTQETLAVDVGPSSSKTAAQPSGRRKGKYKTLAVGFHTNSTGKSGGRAHQQLTGAASEPRNQPFQHLTLLAAPANDETSGAIAQIACDGESVKSAAPFYRGHWGRACKGTSQLRHTILP